MATANVNTVPTKADRTKVVFPRKHLVPGERILWEGRPSTLVYFVRPLIILLVAGAVTGLLLGMGALGKDQIGFILPLMIVVLCLFLLATHHRWGILKEVSDCSYWHYCSYPIILVLERYPSIWRFCPCWSPLSLS